MTSLVATEKGKYYLLTGFFVHHFQISCNLAKLCKRFDYYL